MNPIRFGAARGNLDPARIGYERGMKESLLRNGYIVDGGKTFREKLLERNNGTLEIPAE